MSNVRAATVTPGRLDVYVALQFAGNCQICKSGVIVVSRGTSPCSLCGKGRRKEASH